MVEKGVVEAHRKITAVRLTYDLAGGPHRAHYFALVVPLHCFRHQAVVTDSAEEMQRTDRQVLRLLVLLLGAS